MKTKSTSLSFSFLFSVLRESKITNSATQPPPLHPITKIGLLGKSERQDRSADSIKITENSDSAVITPIPNKKEDINPPEKRKKTISNILRSSSEKRMKKQNFTKSSQEVDISYSLNSPDSEQEKDKKTQNDDDITLIKVVPSEDKSVKLKSIIDDDIKIEMIKSPYNSSAENSSDVKMELTVIKREESKDCINSSNQSDLNFDATKALDWKDGVGSLPGSTLKVIFLLAGHKMHFIAPGRANRSIFRLPVRTPIVFNTIFPYFHLLHNIRFVNNCVL